MQRAHPAIPNNTYYLLPATCYLLPTTYYLLPTTYYLLPTAYYLPATYCLLPTTLLPATCYSYLLPTTYYLLPTTIPAIPTYYLLYLLPTTCYLLHSVLLYLLPPTYTTYYLQYYLLASTDRRRLQLGSWPSLLGRVPPLGLIYEYEYKKKVRVSLLVRVPYLWRSQLFLIAASLSTVLWMVLTWMPWIRFLCGRTCILLWILYGINMVDVSFIVSLYVSDLPNVTISTVSHIHAVTSSN